MGVRCFLVFWIPAPAIDVRWKLINLYVKQNQSLRFSLSKINLYVFLYNIIGFFVLRRWCNQCRHMGSTFMLCTVDQQSGVHGILVLLFKLCWVVPPRATTRATVSTGRLNYSATLLPCRACFFRQRLGPPLRTVDGVSKGMRP